MSLRITTRRKKACSRLSCKISDDVAAIDGLCRNLSLVLSCFLCLLQQQSVVLGLLQAEVRGQPDQKPETVHAVWEPLVNGLVVLQSLLVVACGGRQEVMGMKYLYMLSPENCMP